jgi:nitroreductase
MTFDLAETDGLLATTRSVRRRLDLERPVTREVVLECIRLAVQAPTGGNAQTWRFLVVDDPGTKAALGELYQRAADQYLPLYRAGDAQLDPQTERVLDSADLLAEIMGKAPVLVIPAIRGRLADTSPVSAASMYGSILPAVWSFQLALRSRGLGSCFTTLHLAYEREAAELCGIPDDVTPVALLPVAYTVGTDFRPAERGPVEHITYWNRWKSVTPTPGAGS